MEVPLQIILVGPGRAGTALAIAAAAAGHEIVAIAGRSAERTREVAGRFGAAALSLDDELPEADLLILAVRDDAIAEVAGRLAAHTNRLRGVVHLSGVHTADVLDPFARSGIPTGTLHPLQTLPTPEAGAAALAGSWIAIGAENADLQDLLTDLVRSLGAHPFAVADEDRALYHAAAATAANDVIAVLSLADDLFAAAGVPFIAARPLVEAVVENAFRYGPSNALTGPIARGDAETVAAQLQAVLRRVPEHADQFRTLARLVAEIAGTEEAFKEVL